MKKEKNFQLKKNGKEINHEPMFDFNPVKARKKTNILYWKDQFIYKFLPHRAVLVTIELLNGSHKQFIVREKEGSFKYKGKMFIFDNDAKYYNIDARLWAFDYHENFCLPIKRKIPVDEIRNTIAHSQISEIEYATNPSTLEKFVTSKIAEGILKGVQLDAFMKQIRIILIITMIATIIHLVLFMQKTGMLSNIHMPF